MSNVEMISNELNNYIRVKIGECKSKEEEDEHVSTDITAIRTEMKAQKMDDTKLWELILRVIYAEMLGHSTEFAQSFVVNCVQHPSYRVKRAAYLACSLLLGSESPFRIMVVASLQKDVGSKCLYNKIIALNSLCMLMCPMNVSAFVDCVTQAMASPHAVVKRKALLCFIRMKQLLSGGLGEVTLDHEHQFLQAGNAQLSRSDLTVVLGALGFYRKAVAQFPQKYKALWKLFADILEMLFERKHLPEDYEYEGYHCPWAIMWTLQIIGRLGENDPAITAKFVELLSRVLKGITRIYSDVDCAILYQTIIACLRLFPTKELITLCVDRFELIRGFRPLKTESRRILELRVIERLISLEKSHLARYQIGVVECLDSKDETVRALAIEVLFKAIDERNCQPIIDKILRHLVITSNPKLKKDCINKLLSVLEEMAPHAEWYFRNAWQLLIHGQTHIDPIMVSRVLFIMKELLEALPQKELLEFVANVMIQMSNIMEQKSLNEHLAQTFTWFIRHNIRVLKALEYSFLQMFELLVYLESRIAKKEKFGSYEALFRLKEAVKEDIAQPAKGDLLMTPSDGQSLSISSNYLFILNLLYTPLSKF